MNAKEDQWSAYLKIDSLTGTESYHFAETLRHMYSSWAEKHNYITKEINYYHWRSTNELRLTVTLEITGDFAYGFLKSEMGLHRFCQASFLNSEEEVQSSLVSVSAYPCIEDYIKIRINPSELKWYFGVIDGYNIAHRLKNNQFKTAVRLEHLPTGLVVECRQRNRTQHQNKEKALQMLVSQLYHLENAPKSNYPNVVIRTYSLHSNQMIQDLRTGYERSDIENIFNGDMGGFMKAFLMKS